MKTLVTGEYNWKGLRADIQRASECARKAETEGKTVVAMVEIPADHLADLMDHIEYMNQFVRNLLSPRIPVIDDE